MAQPHKMGLFNAQMFEQCGQIGGVALQGQLLSASIALSLGSGIVCEYSELIFEMQGTGASSDNVFCMVPFKKTTGLRMLYRAFRRKAGSHLVL